MSETLRVFMITSEWPTPEYPHKVPFIVRQVNSLRQAGVDVHVFAFRGNKNPLNYARAWKQAQAEITKGHYDLVHAQWGQSGLLALPKRRPLVVTFRGDDLEGIVGDSRRYLLAGKILRQVSRFVARQADAIILVSEHLSKYLSRKDCTVIPSGLDLERFRLLPRAEARQQLGFPTDKKLALFVGDPNEARKRYPLAKSVVEAIPEAELVLAWRVPHDQIPVFMNACDAMICTSMHEGSPNVVKEALACNLPIVATDVGDIYQRIGNIPGCIVLPDARPETITAALRQVLQRGKRVNSRNTVLDLDETILTQRVIGVYKQALLVRH